MFKIKYEIRVATATPDMPKLRRKNQILNATLINPAIKKTRADIFCLFKTNNPFTQKPASKK